MPSDLPEFEFDDGRKVEIDLNKLSLKEWREFISSAQPYDEGDAMLARIVGMKPEEIEELGYMDYRKLATRIFEIARNPVSDPN